MTTILSVPDRALPKYRTSMFCPHHPTGPQAAFMSLSCREALYGGAAGGGKSDALLMDVLQWVDLFPDFSALIVRRTYQDLALPGAIMDRALEWLSPYRATGRVKWDSMDKRFTFDNGARVQFGYMAGAADKYRYQSAEFHEIVVDELTQFLEEDYAYLMSRLRRTRNTAVPFLKMRGASNPGNIGHEWVRGRFIPYSDEGTGKKVYPHREDGERRVFIPARLWDNPYINAEEYAENLRELDPVRAAQLLEGDWGIRPAGEMFDRTWYTLLDDIPHIGDPWTWIRSWDLAGTKKRSAGHDPDWTVGLLLGRHSPTQRYCVADIVRKREVPGTIEDIIIATAKADKARLGRVSIRIEEEPGSSGKYVSQSYAKALAGYDFDGIAPSGSKSVRAVPYAKASKHGLVDILLRHWTSDYLEELEAFPQHSLHDDQVDASSLAFEQITKAIPPAGASLQTQHGARGSSPYHASRDRVLRRR